MPLLEKSIDCASQGVVGITCRKKYELSSFEMTPESLRGKIFTWFAWGKDLVSDWLVFYLEEKRTNSLLPTFNQFILDHRVY